MGLTIMNKSHCFTPAVVLRPSLRRLAAAGKELHDDHGALGHRALAPAQDASDKRRHRGRGGKG